MGIAKDPYDIVADIWDRIIGARTRTQSSLADYLQEMASLLKEVKSKFEKREVPSGEAKTLALLINDADKLRKRTRPFPVFGLFPRTVLHHAEPHRRKATCLADNLRRSGVRSDRKHSVAASE